MVSDKVGKLFFGYGKLVVVDSGLVSYLMRNELSMVSGRDALVEELLLVGLFHQVCIDELCHLNVVSENIKRHIFVLSNSDEFLVCIILGIVFVGKRKSSVREGAISEGGDWGNDLTKSIIVLNVFNFESSHLLVEELSHIEGVSRRWVVNKLMKEESVVKILQNMDICVNVGPVMHRLEDVWRFTNLRDEHLRRFAHHEDWEVVLLFSVLGFDVIKNRGESMLVSQVDDSFVTVSWHIDTIDLSQKFEYLFIRVQV